MIGHSQQKIEENPMRILTVASLLLATTCVAAHADCTSEVNEAFAKLRKSAAFRMETKITNPQGTLTMSNDYVLPDRMHQKVEMDQNKDAAPGAMEMIRVGDKAWSNQGNAGWAELPPKFVEAIVKQMKETVTDPPKDESKFECLGEVTFEGKAYKAYRTKRQAEQAAGAGGNENVQTVYIDKDLGVPVRNIVTAESDPNKRLFDGTFTLRDGLKIEPPKDTRG
jgi:hypothetical protein